MKLRFIVLGITALFIVNLCQASQEDPTKVERARKKVIERYLQDLQKADYKDIIQLFDKNAYVISTSEGKMDAKSFYYAFLPKIQSAKTELHQLFMPTTDSTPLAARFHYTFKFKDGTEGGGEYVDEFVFWDTSTLLSAVYMFENPMFDADSKVNVK